jgi:hypothetical protein
MFAGNGKCLLRIYILETCHLTFQYKSIQEDCGIPDIPNIPGRIAKSLDWLKWIRPNRI